MGQTANSTVHPIPITSRDGSGNPNGAGDMTAEEFRRLAEAIRGRGAGLAQVGDLVVAALGTPGAQVTVAPGKAWVLGSNSAVQGPYLLIFPASSTLDIPAANTTQQRNDIVAVCSIDADYVGGSTRVAQLQYIANGTPGAGQPYPSPPANGLTVAQIALPSANSQGGATKARPQDITNVATMAALRQGLVELGQLPGIFGSIAAQQTDAANNTRGDLVVATRRVNTDTTLTEALRVLASGGLKAAVPASNPGVGSLPLKVFSTVLGGTQPNISIPSIPQIYKTLRMYGALYSDQSTGSLINWQANADGSALYAFVLLILGGVTTIQKFTGSNGTRCEFGVAGPTGSAHGSIEATWVDYSSTTKWKGSRSQATLDNGTEVTHRIYTGEYLSTNAIASLALIPTTGNFVAGSWVELWAY